MIKSVTIKAAFISAGALIVVGVITAVVTWRSSKPTLSSVGGGNVNVSGKAGNVTITYNVPESMTREAIAALEEKLKTTSVAVELTKNEIRLLAEALKDLDQNLRS